MGEDNTERLVDENLGWEYITATYTIGETEIQERKKDRQKNIQTHNLIGKDT